MIVLLLLAVTALRSYLPGAETSGTTSETREPATGSPANTLAVIAMLTVSMMVIAVAVITQARRRLPAAEAGGERARRRDRLPRPSWRWVLIGAGCLLAWLLLVLLLLRFSPQLDIEAPPPPAGDETTQPPPEAAPEAAEDRPPVAQPDQGDDLFDVLAAATALLVLFTAAAVVIGSRRRRRVPTVPEAIGDTDGPPEPTAEPDLVRAAEVGLAEIGDHSREPRLAIIACYAAMERELEKAPGAVPQLSDTPSEVLARAVETNTLRADSAGELVDLFGEARFSPHDMGEGHRDAAVRALRQVLRDLQETV